MPFYKHLFNTHINVYCILLTNSFVVFHSFHTWLPKECKSYLLCFARTIFLGPDSTCQDRSNDYWCFCFVCVTSFYALTYAWWQGIPQFHSWVVYGLMVPVYLFSFLCQGVRQLCSWGSLRRILYTIYPFSGVLFSPVKVYSKLNTNHINSMHTIKFALEHSHSISFWM